MGDIRRRDFITLLGGAVTPLPLAARAQQSRVPVIGFIASRAAADSSRLVAAFLAGLKETGFVEGQNVAIEYRWAQGRYDRLPGLAADLVGRQVEVIFATSPPAALAAKAATTMIPIVFNVGADPIKIGLVNSFSRPASNVTGLYLVTTQLEPKRLQVLSEMVPTAALIAVLVNPTSPELENITNEVKATARNLGRQLRILNASTERDFDTAFASLAQLRAGGLVIGADAFFVSRSEQLAALALRHAVPAIYQFRAFAAAGGLMSYGSNLTDAYRLAGVYTGRILKGEKPADLPIQQSTKVELIINLKTAKALGLTVPLPLSGRADELIE
jgi:putative tryptophan/tyrosine transport system substrate-binding protein